MYAPSYGRHPVLAVGPWGNACRVSLESRDQRLAKLICLDHVINDQVGGQLVQVDVLAVLVFQLLAASGSLGFRKLSKLVVENGVDGWFGTHDSDLGRG